MQQDTRFQLVPNGGSWLHAMVFSHRPQVTGIRPLSGMLRWRKFDPSDFNIILFVGS